MSQRIRYVGLDVSKETIAVAVAEPDGSVVGYGEIANNPGTVRRLVELSLCASGHLQPAAASTRPRSP